MNKQLDALLCDKNRKNNMKGLLFSAVLMLIVCVSVPGTAVKVCAADSVKYLDANGATKNCTEYTPVESTTTAWNTGWYVVNESTEIEDRIVVTGDVKLILVNKKTLTAKKGIEVEGTNSLITVKVRIIEY